jgi:micrococcal nuclease
MRKVILGLLLAALAAASAGAHATVGASSASAVVASVTDGDTLTLTNGKRVRLLQIDAPELGSGECYSRAARTALLTRAPVGSRIVLEADPRLDEVDRYGRLLRYVHRGTMNVNVALVRAGAAAPYFYRGERGKYASRLMAEATRAKASKRGLWGACPKAVLDPTGPVETGKSGPPAGGRGSKCDPSYPGVCIPPYPPDLDCADVPYRNFAVRPPDPHGFDGDGDGLGCET